jgi:hypothetical protein
MVLCSSSHAYAELLEVTWFKTGIFGVVGMILNFAKNLAVYFGVQPVSTPTSKKFALESSGAPMKSAFVKSSSRYRLFVAEEVDEQNHSQ